MSGGAAGALRANLGLLLFICAGPALTLVNKAILDEGFHHPVIVSGFGMGATMVFSQLLVATGQLHVRSRPPGFFLTHCAPVGASAMATMAFGNAAYLYLNLSFIQILKAGTPVVLMVMLRLAGLVVVTPRLALSVLGMSVGVAIASLGELRFSAIGILVMLLSEVAEGVRCVLKEKILTAMDPPLGVLETLYWLAPACVMWQVLAVVGMRALTAAGLMGAEEEGKGEGEAGLRRGEDADHELLGGSAERRNWLALLILCSCALGVAVNTASLLVIQSRSSLFMKSVVIVRNVGLVLWGVLVHAEAVTLMEAGGYAITLACFAWCASDPLFSTAPA